MKKIEALVRPSDWDALRADLLRDGVDGMTIGEVRVPAHGRLVYRGLQYVREYEPAVRLELAVPDGLLASTLDVLTRWTDAGSPIARNILVLPIHDAVRIGTGEHLVWPRPDRTPAAPRVRDDVPLRRPAA